MRLNPTLLGARMELAQSYIAAKSAQAALDVMDQTPGEQKQLVSAIVERNWALYALGYNAELRKGIDRGLALGKTPDLLVQDGLLRQRQGDFSGARSAWEEALQRNPEDVRAVEDLAKSYAVQNQMAKAVDIVRRYASGSRRCLPCNCCSETGC